MANSPLWQILWVLAAVIAGALMFGAWTGPAPVGIEFVALGDASAHPPRSGMAQSAGRGPVGVSRRAGHDRGVARRLPGSLHRSARPMFARRRCRQARRRTGTAGRKRAAINQRPDRHIDAELKNAILVHVPKTKQVRLVVLKDDPEADQFSWEIDAFLRAEGYTVVPRLFFAMAAGRQDADRNDHLSRRERPEHPHHQNRPERSQLKAHYLARCLDQLFMFCSIGSPS